MADIFQIEENQKLPRCLEAVRSGLWDGAFFEQRLFSLTGLMQMSQKEESSLQLPDVEQLKAELNRERKKRRYKRVLRSTINTLAVVVAVAVLVAIIWMPVLQIYGASMTPTLDEGDIVVCVRGSKFQTGDLMAFYPGSRQ